MLARIVFLYAPAVLLAAGLLAFAAFHAWPLSAVGQAFGRQPGYSPGYAEQALLLGTLLWYLVGYAVAALVLVRCSGSWTAWVRVIVAAATAITIGLLSFADLFGAALSGSRSSGGLALLPIGALSRALLPATAGLRRAHYVALLDDPGRRDDAASGAYSEVRTGGQHDRRLQLGMARGLRSPDERVRYSLYHGLAESYPLARPAALELAERLRDATDEGRAEAAALLGTLLGYGQPEPELRGALLRAAREDRVRAVREAAVSALLSGDRHAPGDKEDPGLRALLERWSAEGDPFAAQSLAELAGGEEGAARAYAKGLASADAAERLAWTQRLAGVNLPDAQVDAAVERALADPEPAVRTAAVGLLRAGRFLRYTRWQLALARALRDPDPGVRQHALFTLDPIGLSWSEAPLPSELLRAVADQLRDPGLRYQAASLLQQLEPRDPAVLRAAVDALATEDWGTGDALRVLLQRRLEDPGMLREVAGLLSSDQEAVRERAVAVLAWRDELRDPELQLALARAVADGREGSVVPDRAARALAKQGVSAPAARKLLEGLAAGAPSPAADRARTALGVGKE